ncbi:hypothetical protein R3P38DRAFT_3308687 [Favolaschia claudopus]|uniref:Uncharacterized protein n=1 Tax=Favolaschia claudopus TaxID=2862362 RepID=A0AAW0CYA7_9AGAR
MRPARHLRLFSLGLRPRPMPMRPFYASPTLSSSFMSTQPEQTIEKQKSYFRRLDDRIAEKLGIGRGMRITIYAIFGVTTAIETWFYCFWAWNWWKRRNALEGEENVET